jgi:predicted helicase
MRGDVRTAGKKLAPADDELLRVLTDFLSWLPQSPASLKQLVRNVAGLCRLLREEVDEALAAEKAGDSDTHFSRLAADWRQLLFPDLSDAAFADGYAQTVTFALLLARVEGIIFDDRSIGEIAVLLGKSHSLMGKALSVLTEDWSLGKLKVTVDTLVRVVGAVNWDAMDKGTDDAYLYLYEQFLQEYDPQLRKQTGSYYTPNDVVGFMVRFVDQILRERLRLESGLASYNLKIVDPAMGTGTFLINVIDRVARTVGEEEGLGAVGPRLQELAERLVGFEKQTGPYAVAELRVSEAIHRHQQTEPPAQGMRLYLADTLANPFSGERQLDEFLPPSLGPGSTYEPIAKSLRGANEVKAREPVLIIGNPPYRDKAKGLGGWVEKGDPKASPAEPPLIDAFRTEGSGKFEYVLSNTYVYFWRWATWKIFEAHPDEPSGVAAFITTAGYLQGRGFAGMRRYLRETADEGWIIDVTPERHWPPVPTRLFPAVHQPLCIAIFARYGLPNPEQPANLHYLSIAGSRQDKFSRLDTIDLHDPEWETCSTRWNASFVSRTSVDWDSFPAIADLFPWAQPGIKPNRTWVYSPTSPSFMTGGTVLSRHPKIASDSS